MAKVSVHVWHTISGEIVAVGRSTGVVPCVPLGDQNQAVIELDVDEKQARQLHRTHVVDIARKALIKRVRTTQ